MKHKISFFIILLTTLPSWGQSQFLDCSESLRKQRWQEIAQIEKSPLVHCKSPTSLPEAAREIMDKAQDVLSAFVVAEKLSDCFSIEPLRLLPKFSNESGLVSQIQNITGKDTGLGQLTGPAIRDVQDKWKKLKTEIDSSSKASCVFTRELIDSKGNVEFFSFSDKQRCQLMYSEDGAIRNMVFSLFFHRINRDYVNFYFQQKEIVPLLLKAGGSEDFVEPLKELMVMLAYNSGAKTAVVNLKSFLESRIDFTTRKVQEFDLSQGLTPEQQKSLRKVSARDFDFSSGNQDYRHLIEDLPRDESGRVSAEVLRNISTSLMTFPVWLRVWQTSGAPGYLSYLSDESQRMSLVFGSQCVDSGFYRPNSASGLLEKQ